MFRKIAISLILLILTSATLALTSYGVTHLSEYEECACQYRNNNNNDATIENSYSISIRCALRVLERHNAIITALATIVIALFTVILAIVTSRQAKLTAIAAEAAKKSADIAQAGLIDLQRAFVFMKGELAEVTGGGINVNIIWENSGATPTKHLLTHISWESFTGDIPHDFAFPDYLSDASLKAVRSLLGPKGTVRQTIHIPGENIQAMQAGTHKTYVWGWAEYNDIFKDTKRHRTEFCMRIVLTQLPNGYWNADTQTHSKHNGAEDECMYQPKPYPHLTPSP